MLVLRPKAHFERVDFLGADIAGDERRIVRSKAPNQPPVGPRGRAPDALQVCDVLDFAVTQSKTEDVTDTRLVEAPKIKEYCPSRDQVSKPIGDPTTSDHF